MSSYSNKSQMKKILSLVPWYSYTHWYSLVKKVSRLAFHQKTFQSKEIKIEDWTDQNI